MKAPGLSIDTRGVFVITVTPFLESGAIDVDGVLQMTDFFCELGVQGLTILGVAGEASKMTEVECEALAARVIGRVGGRLPVVVGISNASMASVEAFGKRSMELGAAGVMLQPTGALKTDDDVYRYMTTALEALGSDVPLVYQDYPQFSGVTMPLSVWARLVREFPQIVMMKHEQTPGLGKLSAIRALERDGLRRTSILVGNNALFLPQELSRGADGAMTGFAFPDMLVEVLDHWQAGREDRASDIFDAYLPLLRYELQPGFGLSIRKEILKRRGAIPHSTVRYPRTILALSDLAELDALLTRLRRRLESLGARVLL